MKVRKVKAAESSKPPISAWHDDEDQIIKKLNNTGEKKVRTVNSRRGFGNRNNGFQKQDSYTIKLFRR